MKIHINRRGFLYGGAGLAIGATGAWPRRALAKETIKGIEWGGAYVDVLKEIAAKQDQFDVNFDLYVTGSAEILPKLKATWPDSPYDFITSASSTFPSIIAEGWAEEIDESLIPNLANVPDSYRFKDKDGKLKNVPRSISEFYFGYRNDTAPIALERIDDLLSPDLKSQICWPHPIQMGGLHIIALARHAGGDEYNMEPGWKLLKELAKSGNIGRVAQSDSDFINSMTTGECSVSFWHMAGWDGVAKHVPVTEITKKEGFTTYLTTTGYVVVASSPRKREAMQLINFLIAPENVDLYCRAVGEAPANTAVAPDPAKAHTAFSPEEVEKFTYLPDWAYMSTQKDGWIKRWEQEIAPLL